MGTRGSSPRDTPAEAWLISALDLAFLLPWWRGGFAIHGAGFHPMQIFTMGTPIGVMALTCAAVYRTWRRASAELRWLERPPWYGEHE